MVAYLTSPSGSEARDIAGADEEDSELREPSWGRYYLEIQLSGKDLKRLDEEAKAYGAPRRRWIVALIRKRLHGGHQFSRPERIQLANIVRELRKIDSKLLRLVSAIGDRQKPLQALTDRLDDIQNLQGQVAQTLAYLRVFFRKDDEYWGDDSKASTDCAQLDETDE